MFKLFRNKKGFSLVELLVVVAIIGILAVAIVPNFLGGVDDSRVSRTHADIRAIEDASSVYRIRNGSFPTNNEQLQSLILYF